MARVIGRGKRGTRPSPQISIRLYLGEKESVHECSLPACVYPTRVPSDSHGRSGRLSVMARKKERQCSSSPPDSQVRER